MSDENRGLPTRRGRDNAYTGNASNTDGWQRTRFKPIGIDTDGTYIAHGIQLYYSYNEDFSNSAPLQGATIARDVYIFPDPLDALYSCHYYIDAPQFKGGPAYREESGSFAINGGNVLPISAFSKAGEHSIGARIVLVNGDVGLITAFFDVEQITQPQVGNILSDRNKVLTLTGQAGSTVPDLVFNLSTDIDEGSAVTVTYSAVDDQTWLSPSIVGGALTLAFPGVNALAAGSYQGTVTVSASTTGAVTYNPMTITVGLTVTSAANYTMVTSDDSAFANPTNLNNAAITGSKYISILPITGVSSVAWTLDGVAQKTRTASPFDFGAEATGTASVIYDTGALANGTHNLTAVVTPTGGQRNFILQSQTLSTSPWSVFTVTVATGDTIAGPDGSTLMYVSQNTGAVAIQHTLSQLITKPSATVQSFAIRVYLKPKSGSEHYYFRLIVDESNLLPSFCSIYFRLDPGNVGIVSSGAGTGWTVTSATLVESSVSGIYQLDVTGSTNSNANLYARIAWNSSAGGSSTYAAGAATGVYMAWQVDFGGAAMTAYAATTTSQIIATGGTPVTVSADFSTNNAPRVLIASVPDVVFSATAGGANPANQTFNLTPSASTATWTSAEIADIPWLTVNSQASTATGTATPAAPQVITLAATTGALTAGNYTGTLRFTAPGYTGVDVPVQFNVAAAAPTVKLYYSTTGVGLGTVTALENATISDTTGIFLWLASTTTPAVPYTLAAGQSFDLWANNTTTAQESTSPITVSFTAGQQVILGTATAKWRPPTAGVKFIHYRLFAAGAYSRNDITYNYLTTAATTHKHEPGVWLRVDRIMGRLSTQTDGQTFLNQWEIPFVQHPACKGLLFAFGWKHIDRNASPGGAFYWTQVDACIALAASYGKKAGFRIAPQHWGQPPSYIYNNSNLYDIGSSEGNPLWSDPTVRSEWKRMWRAFSARYDDNPNVILATTDEAWWAPSAAWKALGRSETALSAAYHSLNLEIMTEIDPAVGKRPFRRTHWFVGGNQAFEGTAPGGNFDQMVNAGVGIYQPDGLAWNKSLIGTQGLLLKYKGRMTGLLFGDGGSMGGSDFAAVFPNAPMASYKMNADYRVPNATAEYNPGTSFWGASKAECMEDAYFALMAHLTGVGRPPANPNWDADVIGVLNYVQANGFPNTTPASNLALKV